jgi:membrane-associated phospholipid phosphatase
LSADGIVDGNRSVGSPADSLRSAPASQAQSGDARRRDAGICRRTELRAQIDAVDRAVYDAVAVTPTPELDRLLVGVSNAANHSRLWLAAAAALAIVGGHRGRRAATEGVLAIALTSAVTNIILKPLAGRRRPAESHGRPVPRSRRVRQPASRSFPSGHAASAFAFATTVEQSIPSLGVPLRVAAATVAYSRIHTGVHYPSDVGVGAIVGTLCGDAVRRLARHMAPPAQAR